MDEILSHFPGLTEIQKNRFGLLDPLYREWNARINVISRKDMDHFYVHHVLHSLAIAKWITFRPEARILDLGTGGGFPGIPLAILFPETDFTLMDGTRKKIAVVEAVVTALGLDNVTARAERAEDHKGKYEFVVTRAVAPLGDLYRWSKSLVHPHPQRHALPNGLIALKGGHLETEIKWLPRKTAVETEAIQRWFPDPWFEGKSVVWVQI